MTGASGTVSVHGSGPSRRTAVWALAVIAMAVTAASIGLWRETTAYEWRILGLGTLARVKLFAGFSRWSDQRYEWMEGSIRPASLASIVRDPMIDRTRERFAGIAVRNAPLGLGLGVGACLVLLVFDPRRPSGTVPRADGGAARLARIHRRRQKRPAERAPPLPLRRVWRIVGVRVPRGAETHHIMVSGASGSGRTALVADLLGQIRARGERCIVHDPTGNYTKLFYDPTRDVLLNPLDARCPRWSPMFEADCRGGFEALAAALFSEPADAAGRFRAMAARQLFTGAAEALRREGISANGALLDLLLAAPPAALVRSLEGSSAQPIVDRLDRATLHSVRTLLGAVVAPLRFLPNEGDPFSIRNWARREGGTDWLFLAAPGDRHGRMKGLVSFWAELALSALQALDPERERPLWAVFDDPAALHRLPALLPALANARRLGVRFLIAIEAVGALRALYGKDGAETISALCGTRVAMMAADEETAEWSSANLGDDPRTVAWPWEIRRLPHGHGHVRFAWRAPRCEIRAQ